MGWRIADDGERPCFPALSCDLTASSLLKLKIARVMLPKYSEDSLGLGRALTLRVSSEVWIGRDFKLVS